MTAHGRAKIWWATQWNVCRAGGAARPQWPHTPMLHGYRGLYGSLRTSRPQQSFDWCGEQEGRQSRCSPLRRGVTQRTSGSLANEERVFLKRIKTAETLLKAYTYKQHECDYHIPTVYMVLRFPGSGKVHHHNANLHLPCLSGALIIVKCNEEQPWWMRQGNVVNEWMLRWHSAMGHDSVTHGRRVGTGSGSVV
ncbi:hypothetical protein SK128_027183 [Halocaridina rubra]|uniref:Uncharacterized protein n=1 Tax=Halocaridina rubra TaxID=373956 RepID=A0AAN8XDB5_HALRR